MTQYDVLTPEGNIVQYETGQPMGAYTSWAVFTLCHHLLVQYAARKVFKTNKFFLDYKILGDDIVIYDERVASHYKELCSNLGVNISDDKSIVSQTTLEFAKRDFHNGIEFSPISIGSILNSYGT
jgi:hypothetical protein